MIDLYLKMLLPTCEALHEGMLMTVTSISTGTSVVIWTADLVTSCSWVGG